MEPSRGVQPYPIQMIRHKKSRVKDPVESMINDKIERTIQKSDSEAVKGPLDPMFGQHRAFPISIDTKNIDPNRKPQDVMEYLAQVRLEAQRSEIIDSGRYKYSDSGALYRLDDHKNDSKILVVDKATSQKYMNKYYEARTKYCSYRNQLTELNAIDLPKTQREWKYFIFNNEPTYDFVAQIIEEKQVMKLIVYFTKWLNMDVNSNFESWIWMILEATDSDLDSSNQSVMRNLGKKAQKQLRNKLDERNTMIMMKILTIVGVFYRQKDLLEKEDLD